MAEDMGAGGGGMDALALLQALISLRIDFNKALPDLEEGLQRGRRQVEDSPPMQLPIQVTTLTGDQKANLGNLSRVARKLADVQQKGDAAADAVAGVQAETDTIGNRLGKPITQKITSNFVGKVQKDAVDLKVAARTRRP
jgi:aspartate ammonia-lyase